MATLPTLIGAVDTAGLGRTLMPEHILDLSWEVQGPYPGFNGWDPDVEVPKADEELRELKAAGYDTLVELSVLGWASPTGSPCRTTRAASATGSRPACTSSRCS